MQFAPQVKIGSFEISASSPTYVIAEAGVNHNGNVALARKMVDVAVAAGANAVKFQAFRTEELILPNVEKAPYQKTTTGAGEGQFEMLQRLEMRVADFAEIKKYCEQKGITFLITPFDEVSLRELDALHLDAYKVASTDLTNLPFLRKIAQKGKPILLSTGMSYLEEVEAALREIEPLERRVVLFHCTGNYPTPPEEVHLRVLPVYREKFGVLTGYSDHTEGLGASPYAVVMGAKVIEKHFTLDKSMEGPDQRASLSPEELTAFIREIRRAEAYLGQPVKVPQASEIHTRASLQKCLVASRDIPAGEVFGDENVVAKRSGGRGLSPLHYRKVFGQKAPRAFRKNDLIEV